MLQIVPAPQRSHKRVERDLHVVAARGHVLQQPRLPKCVVHRLLHVFVLQLLAQHVGDLRTADGAGAVGVQLGKHSSRLLNPHIFVARLQHLPVHLARHELSAGDDVVVDAQSHVLQQVDRLVARHLEAHLDQPVREHVHCHRGALKVELLHQLPQHLRVRHLECRQLRVRVVALQQRLVAFLACGRGGQFWCAIAVRSFRRLTAPLTHHARHVVGLEAFGADEVAGPALPLG
mmetsp:Transcript_35358/g.63054  ORF Transcript_35358/g.63054 Transcript_35358/m.63054 type:complete len:233 (-) Transcript_35358:202-900(-)